MLLGKLKRIVIALLVVFFTAEVFAATTDLAVRFLDKANEAYEDGNIEDAYKYVNQALAVAKDEDSQTNVLYFAQTVYKQKLINLQLLVLSAAVCSLWLILHVHFPLPGH